MIGEERGSGESVLVQGLHCRAKGVEDFSPAEFNFDVELVWIFMDWWIAREQDQSCRIFLAPHIQRGFSSCTIWYNGISLDRR